MVAHFVVECGVLPAVLRVSELVSPGAGRSSVSAGSSSVMRDTVARFIVIHKYSTGHIWRDTAIYRYAWVLYEAIFVLKWCFVLGVSICNFIVSLLYIPFLFSAF